MVVKVSITSKLFNSNQFVRNYGMWAEFAEIND